MLQDIMISKCRVRLLEIFFAQPIEIFYIRQLVRLAKEEINAVRRELNHLEIAGIVKKEHRGNRIYYWLNKDHPLYSDLLSLVSKSVGLGGAIVENKSKLGKVRLAMLSGRFARGLSTKEGAVDLLVVGEIAMQELVKIIREGETAQGKEINYTVMTKQEFDFRKKRHDPFLYGILTDARIMLIGDDLELVE